MPWGQRREQRRAAVEKGGTLKGGQAKKASQRGGLGEDGKVHTPRGKVIGDFSNRTQRQPNEHGV